MAQNKQTYHALAGPEVDRILMDAFQRGIRQAFDLRNIRAYPLLKYKFTLELTPYQPAGEQAPVPDVTQRCVIEGQVFQEVTSEAISLIEESPIIGHEVDPQKVRERAGIGQVIT